MIGKGTRTTHRGSGKKLVTMIGKGTRTTHRGSGKKLYAVRDAKGRFKDIQTYERAHRQHSKASASRDLAAHEAALRDIGARLKDLYS
jgi:hypothetical protein